MKKLLIAFCTLCSLALLTTAALASQLNLKFVDQAGKPIADVVVRYSYERTPILTPGGTFEAKSDAEGKVSIAHPCYFGGSCCVVVGEVTYEVRGKFGYSISGHGTVECGAGSSDLTITGAGQEYPKLSAVSAASYRETLTSEMIVAAFGANLSTTTAAATDLPLPTKLAGRQLFVRDSDGRERTAQLLFVSPTQINFIMTSEGVLALRTLIVRDENNQVVSVGFPQVTAISAGIFTANADGQGVPAAVIVRARADGSQQYEPVNQLDPQQQKFVPIPLDLGPESDIIVLALFGTGWRQIGSATATVKIGGIDCPVEYIGKQPTIEGLDQINVRLPRTLIGKGDVTVQLEINSAQANPVQLKIK